MEYASHVMHHVKICKSAPSTSIVSLCTDSMATPLKLYPELPAPSPLAGLKRKAGSGVFVSEGKENISSLVAKKKQKVI